MHSSIQKIVGALFALFSAYFALQCIKNDLDWQITLPFIIFCFALLIWILDLPIQLTTQGIVQKEVKKQLEIREKILIRQICRVLVEIVYMANRFSGDDIVKRKKWLLDELKQTLSNVGFNDNEIDAMSAEWSVWPRVDLIHDLKKTLQQNIKENYCDTFPRHKAVQGSITDKDIEEIKGEVDKYIQGLPEPLQSSLSIQLLDMPSRLKNRANVREGELANVASSILLERINAFEVNVNKLPSSKELKEISDYYLLTDSIQTNLNKLHEIETRQINLTLAPN